VLLCLVVLAGVASADGNSPKIEIPVGKVELGDVDRGEVVTVSFEVRNTGQADLHIRDAKPG
jgi:hypothetical protein